MKKGKCLLIMGEKGGFVWWKGYQDLRSFIGDQEQGKEEALLPSRRELKI